MSDTIQCPSCHGKGESFAFVNTGADSSKHYSGMVKCHRCGGLGKVPSLMSDWISASNRFRAARIADGLYMHDVGERLGVSAAAVSKAYNGLIDPAPLIEAWEARAGNVGAG